MDQRIVNGYRPAASTAMHAVIPPDEAEHVDRARPSVAEQNHGEARHSSCTARRDNAMIDTVGHGCVVQGGRRSWRRGVIGPSNSSTTADHTTSTIEVVCAELQLSALTPLR